MADSNLPKQESTPAGPSSVAPPQPTTPTAAAPYSAGFSPGDYQSALENTTSATFARTAAAYASRPPQGLIASPTLIDSIVCDHSQIMCLFAHFFQAAEADATHIMSLVSGSLALELRLHSQAEISILYPVLQQRLGTEGLALTQRALAEHAMVEQSIEEILRLRGLGDKEKLINRVKQCQTETMTHNAEEEAMLLPRLAMMCTPEELVALGLSFRAAKAIAPLMPQPGIAKAVASPGGGSPTAKQASVPASGSPPSTRT